MSIWKRQEWDDSKNMKERWSHSIVSQCFTQILCTLSSDSIDVKVECSECLYERDMNEIMVKTRRSDDLTLLCRNASPKYCAPSAPIWLRLKLSVVSVCTKETKMSEWRRRWWNVTYADKGWISGYTFALLVGQESDASDLTGNCTEWMCKLYGGVSVKYRCAWWVPNGECVSEDVYIFEKYEAIFLCRMFEFWVLSYTIVTQTLSCIVYSIAQDWCMILILEWLK